MRQPGVEPGAIAWKAMMLPLHYWRKGATGIEPAAVRSAVECSTTELHTLFEPNWESNPGPLAPKARIIPLDHQAITACFIK